jgi:HK97 family phage major capsid protein
MEKKVFKGTLKEAYEQRNKLATDLKAFREELKGGTIDQEKSRQIDAMLDEHTDLHETIETMERLERTNFEQAKQEIDKKVDKEEKKEERNAEKAFENFLRYGAIDPLDRDLMSELSAKGANIMGNVRASTDPQGTAVAVGGYMIPKGFQAQLDQAMLPYFVQYDACTVLPTSTGNELHWPTVNDTANKGHLLTEHSQDVVYKVDFSEVIFYAFMFTSYIVKVSLQLLQDSAIPVEPVLSNLLGERLGRVLADYFTTGTGSTTQPDGIVHAATASGVTSVSASAITRDNILDLIYSVYDNYRSAPGAALIMHDTTLKAIAKLTIGTNDDRPLWQPSIITGQPDTIEGKRFYINNSMDEIGAGKYSIIFGDLKKFVIRRVLGTTLFVYREKYMDYLQVGFQAYCRWDSRLLDAGTHPIKKLLHANT